MKQLFWKRMTFLFASVLCILLLAGWRSDAASGNMEFPVDAGQAYRSLADAMSSDGFSDENIPIWIPADYSISMLQRIASDNSVLYLAGYESDRGMINLIVNIVTISDGMASYFKDEGGYFMTHNDTEFFVYTNTGDYCAVWQIDEYLCSIASFDEGDMTRSPITEEELLSMIRSIG